MAATLADPQYKAGRKLIDDGRLEEAVNFFSGLLETRVAVLSGNEMCPALAPLYYEYGNSLLYNAEESGAVFGDAITEVEKKKAMAIVDAQLQGTSAQLGENGGGAASDGGGGGAAAGGAEDGADGDAAAAPTPDQEAEEDLEIAWENLEMARRIYSELELTEEIRVAIGKVREKAGAAGGLRSGLGLLVCATDKAVQQRTWYVRMNTIRQYTVMIALPEGCPRAPTLLLLLLCCCIHRL